MRLHKVVVVSRATYIQIKNLHPLNLSTYYWTFHSLIIFPFVIGPSPLMMGGENFFLGKIFCLTNLSQIVSSRFGMERHTCSKISATCKQDFNQKAATMRLSRALVFPRARSKEVHEVLFVCLFFVSYSLPSCLLVKYLWHFKQIYLSLSSIRFLI